MLTLGYFGQGTKTGTKATESTGDQIVDTAEEDAGWQSGGDPSIFENTGVGQQQQTSCPAGQIYVPTFGCVPRTDGSKASSDTPWLWIGIGVGAFILAGALIVTRGPKKATLAPAPAMAGYFYY